MTKVQNVSSIRFTEYDDCRGQLELFRMDMSSRRMVPEFITYVDLGGTQPPTALEALFIGAAEALGRTLYGFDQLT